MTETLVEKELAGWLANSSSQTFVRHTKSTRVAIVTPPNNPCRHGFSSYIIPMFSSRGEILLDVRRETPQDRTVEHPVSVLATSGSILVSKNNTVISYEMTFNDDWH